MGSEGGAASRRGLDFKGRAGLQLGRELGGATMSGTVGVQQWKCRPPFSMSNYSLSYTVTALVQFPLQPLCFV